MPSHCAGCSVGVGGWCEGIPDGQTAHSYTRESRPPLAAALAAAQERVAEVEGLARSLVAVLVKIHEHAAYLRGDWSGFDGRTHLAEVRGFVVPALADAARILDRKGGEG